jgi:D-3-phosphoglycerate dehydrogenase
MARPIAAVVDLERYPGSAVARLGAHVEVFGLHSQSVSDLTHELRNLQPTILFCGIHHRIDDELLGGCSKLRMVASPATGLTHLDLEYLRHRAIRVLTLLDCSGVTTNVFATAEHAWLLTLALQRQLFAAAAAVGNGTFRRDAFLGQSLQDRVLGVVGLGRLGRRVASYGTAFGMEVCATDPRNACMDFDSMGVRMVGLEELLHRADVVSIHVPLDQSAMPMIGTDEVALMKVGSTLVNTSRGELLDEQAVACSLVDGRLGGVGVDVLAGESDPTFDARQSPLVRAQSDGFNVIVTPHIGGWTESAVSHTRSALVEAVLREVGGA